MAIHSSILAWKILWTEEPGRLQSSGLQESDMIEHVPLHARVHTNTHTHTHTHRVKQYRRNTMKVFER